MATKSYGSGGWAEGFNSTRDAIQGYQRDTELANLEDPSQSPGLANAVAPSPDAAPPDTSATGLADAQQMQANRRASVMRRYGDADGANKELEANSRLGLASAQTREHQARTASALIKNKGDQRDLDSQNAVKAIDDDIARQLREKNVDIATPMGAVAAGKLRVDALMKAGHFEVAKGATDTMLQTQGGLLKSQAGERTNAANEIVMAHKGGQLTPDLVSKFHDLYIPDGTTTKGVVMNGDGGFTLTTVDGAGKTATQTVKGKDLPNLYGVLGSPNASDAIAKRLDDAAKLRLHEAQASSAGASAAHHSASTKLVNEQLGQTKVLNQRENAVWGARSQVGPKTQQQEANIEAADDANASRRSASAEAKKPYSFNKDPMGKVISRTNGVTGQVELANEDGTFAEAGASPAQPAANTIPADPKKRVVGQVYTNPAGKKAKWTGQGWQTE